MARLKAGIHFASSILVKVVSGLIVIKLLAWKLGPDSFGMLGQLMTLVAIVSMFAGGGITNGLIKVLAESPLTSKEGRDWFATAFTLTTAVSAVIALVLIIFSTTLSSHLMQGGFVTLFVGLGLVQAVVAYGNLVQAEASSRGASGFYAKVNIIGSGLGAVVLTFGVYLFGFDGAAYSIMLMPALAGFVALLFVAYGRRELYKCSSFLLDKIRMRHLLSFSVLALIGSTSVPVAQILMRDSMAQQFGWEQVGLWQGVIKLSDVYMQFVGVILINYVLPRYASATDFDFIYKEFKVSLLCLLSALLVGFVVLYSLRHVIIKLIFSDEFLPMTNYFLPQMVGDVFRTIASAISLVFMARGALRVSIMFEFAQGLFLFVVYSILLGSYGIMTPVYAHVITYGLLSMLMAVALRIWLKRGTS